VHQSVDGRQGIVAWAATEAKRLLEGLPGYRWHHVEGVVLQATRVAEALPESERAWLIAAAYLHDIGWAPALRDTGFHPVDGARWLRTQGHERLAGLVAYHSCAEYEAELRGLATELSDFQNEASSVSGCLTYCDVTTGSDGTCVSLEQRQTDVVARHGSDSLVALAMERSLPCLQASMRRVEQSMSRLPLPP
jgi:hypothetical protein